MRLLTIGHMILRIAGRAESAWLGMKAGFSIFTLAVIIYEPFACVRREVKDGANQGNREGQWTL